MILLIYFSNNDYKLLKIELTLILFFIFFLIFLYIFFTEFFPAPQILRKTYIDLLSNKIIINFEIKFYNILKNVSKSGLRSGKLRQRFFKEVAKSS